MQKLRLREVKDLHSPNRSGSEVKFSRPPSPSSVSDVKSPIRLDSGHHPSPLHPWFFSCAFKASGMFCPAGVPTRLREVKDLHSPNRSGSEVKLTHPYRFSSVSDLHSPILSGSETKLPQKVRLREVKDLHSPNRSGSEANLMQFSKFRVLSALHSPNLSGSDSRFLQ